MSTPVIIVGAGPTGLVLALTLLKSGIPVRIVDKVREYHAASRGAGVQPRTQEIEHFLGTLEDAKIHSMPVPDIYYYDLENPHQVRRKTSMVECVNPTPQFPFSAPFVLDQYLHEGVLRSHIEALGGSIELNTEVLSLEQDEHGVKVLLRKVVDGKEVQETAQSLYVAGCDGGQSRVRKLLGLQFLGQTHEEERLLTADVDAQGLEGNAWHTFTNDFSVFISFRCTNIPERYQLYLGGSRYIEIAEECAKASVEELEKIITKVTNRMDIKLLKIHTKLEWRYNVRMVDHFHRGRVFIAGDAAHTHSPMGGQGLNSSVQDAFNLAWKLALAVKGHASADLLSSYGEERLPVIADMLLETTKLHRLANDKGPSNGTQNTIDALGDAVAPFSAASPAEAGGDKKDKANGIDPRLNRPRKLFQLDINYRWSPIVLDERHAELNIAKDAYGKTGHDLRAGDRAPDAPGLVALRKGNPVGKVAGRPGEIVRLFNIFDPTVHTTLIFSSGTDATFIRDVQSALKELPEGFVRSVLIVPQSSSDDSFGISAEQVDLSLVDKGGHAFHGYGIQPTADAVVIIRPDAMVGAFVTSGAGINRYFGKVFASGSA